MYSVTERSFRVEFIMYVANNIYCNSSITKSDHLLIKLLIYSFSINFKFNQVNELNLLNHSNIAALYRRQDSHSSISLPPVQSDP